MYVPKERKTVSIKRFVFIYFTLNVSKIYIFNEFKEFIKEKQHH